MFEVMVFFFPGVCDVALFWGWLNTCLLMGRGELIPCFAFLACVAFALTIKFSLSQLMSFLAFTCPIPAFFLPSGIGESEWLCGVKPQQSHL